MVTPTFRRKQPRLAVLLAGLCLAAGAAPANADGLSSRTFQLEHDASGITSLKRTGDVADTDYIAANAALGRLIVRYRTSAHGDWKELRDLVPRPGGPEGTITYSLGALLPTLASRASGSAVQGVAGVRGLNDGVVPMPAGGGRGGRRWWARCRAARRHPGVHVDAVSVARPSGFSTPFPRKRTIGRTEVFWTVAPQSWRLLYQDAGQWKEVQAERRLRPRDQRVLRGRVHASEDHGLAYRGDDDTRGGAGPGGVARRARPGACTVERSRRHRNVHAATTRSLEWTIILANQRGRPVEIGDLAVPLHSRSAPAPAATSTRRSCCAIRSSPAMARGSTGSGATRDGPYLVMTPSGQRSSSTSTARAGRSRRTSTRRRPAPRPARRAATGGCPVSSLTIAAEGNDHLHVHVPVGEGRRRRARGPLPRREVRHHHRARHGRARRSAGDDFAAHAQHDQRAGPRVSGATKIAWTPCPRKPSVYTVKFSQLGENMLHDQIRRAGQWSTLEFFVTEPLETVIQKRAAFLVSHHQHTDPSKWYVGMYSDWDRRTRSAAARTIATASRPG